MKTFSQLRNSMIQEGVATITADVESKLFRKSPGSKKTYLDIGHHDWRSRSKLRRDPEGTTPSTTETLWVMNRRKKFQFKAPHEFKAVHGGQFNLEMVLASGRIDHASKEISIADEIRLLKDDVIFELVYGLHKEYPGYKMYIWNKGDVYIAKTEGLNESVDAMTKSIKTWRKINRKDFIKMYGKKRGLSMLDKKTRIKDRESPVNTKSKFKRTRLQPKKTQSAIVTESRHVKHASTVGRKNAYFVHKESLKTYVIASNSSHTRAIIIDSSKNGKRFGVTRKEMLPFLEKEGFSSLVEFSDSPRANYYGPVLSMASSKGWVRVTTYNSGHVDIQSNLFADTIPIIKKIIQEMHITSITIEEYQSVPNTKTLNNLKEIVYFLRTGTFKRIKIADHL